MTLELRNIPLPALGAIAIQLRPIALVGIPSSFYCENVVRAGRYN